MIRLMMEPDTPDRFAVLLEDLPLHELAFTPVPVKARHDGWSAERQRGFILRLALAGNVSMAARAVGGTRESIYRLRRHPGAASFNAAWDKALGWGKSRALDLAIERAIAGEVHCVYYRGRKVGEVIRHDNRLLIAALRTLDAAAAPIPDAAAFAQMLDPISPHPPH